MEGKKGTSAGKKILIVFLCFFIALLVIAGLFFMLPVYKKDTKNQRSKVCYGNMRIIQSNLAFYMLNGNDGKPFENIDDIDLNSRQFNDMFDMGAIVKCTSGGKEVDYDIVIKDTKSFSITCQNPACPNCGESKDYSYSENS